MLVIVLVTFRNVFKSFFLAEICCFNSCTFLNSCDKTARIARVFTNLTMLNLVHFPVFFFEKYFLLCLSFLRPQIYYLMKSNSSTETTKIACDFVVCYGGESVCENPIRLKTTEILRSNLVVSQNVYLGLANNTWRTK